MRLVRVIAILALLIGFPALSWYYLQTGADWRKSGLDELADKKEITLPAVTSMNGDQIGEDVFSGKFIVYCDLDVAQHESTLQGLDEQFRSRKDVLLVNLKAVPNGSDWLYIDCESSDCAWLRQNIFDGGSANCALIDSDMNLRRTYDLANDEELKDLVRHAGILFPIEKRKKIELKRGQQ